MLQNVFGSDHLPLEATVSFPGSLSLIPPLTSNTDKAQLYIRWDKLNEHQTNEINNAVDTHLDDFSSSPLYDLYVTGCRDPEHLEMIDELNENIVNTSQSSSQLHMRCIEKNKFDVIPEWNWCAKDKHKVARGKYRN